MSCSYTWGKLRTKLPPLCVHTWTYMCAPVRERARGQRSQSLSIPPCAHLVLALALVSRIIPFASESSQRMMSAVSGPPVSVPKVLSPVCSQLFLPARHLGPCYHFTPAATPWSSCGQEQPPSSSSKPSLSLSPVLVLI